MIGRPAPDSPTGSVTDVAGVLVGHHTALGDDVTVADARGPGRGAATGTTVVILPEGTTAAVDVRGGGPGTRETDLLDPSHSVQQIDAVVLGGGSAYGLAAADGVMTWLEENGRGIPMGAPGAVVPIVPAAVIFDLPVGDWSVRPTAEFGYRAAASATVDFALGSVGGGTGARAGVLKGGVGTASTVIVDGFAAGVTVAAVVVANPVGSVFDPDTGVLWGAGHGLLAPDPAEVRGARLLTEKATALNTTIGVVATDAPLSSSGCRRLAVAAHDGLARAVRPVHSPLDGDTIFAVATGRASVPADPSASTYLSRDIRLLDALCRVVAPVVERAVVSAVLAATAVARIPTYRQQFPSAFH